MPDFTSLYICDTSTIQNVLKSTLLTFNKEITNFNKKTGEVLKIYYYNYLNLIFIFKQNSNGVYYELQIKGSIHYYFNLGIHNANMFSFNEFIDTVNDLLTKFSLDPLKCILRPCEYGFNFPFMDSENIPHNCMSENRKLFKYEKFPFAVSGVKQNDFQIKVYCKSIQFPHISEPHLLRIEEKNNRSRSWQNLDIYNLYDLMQKDNHIKIYKQFKQRIKQLVIYDDQIKKSTVNRTKLSQFNNPNYWRKLINKGGQNKEYNKKKIELEKLSKNQGANLLESLLNAIDIQYHKNYNLLIDSTYKISKTGTYAQYKKSTDAHLCIECNGVTVHKFNIMLTPVLI